MLLVTKRPTQTRLRSEVTAGKVIGRLTVKAAIEGNVPGKITHNLNVIGRVHIEFHSTALSDDWQKIGCDVRICFIESEELNIPSDQA